MPYSNSVKEAEMELMVTDRMVSSVLEDLRGIIAGGGVVNTTLRVLDSGNLSRAVIQRESQHTN